jgi:hypothetical protein
LNWQLNSSIWIKGGIYFAITPDAMMAGGKLEASFNAGPLRADFVMGADFLMQWKPFHYEGRIYIEASVDFDAGLFDISGSFGAELSMWGPDFAGHAKVHLGPVSASISFGADKAPPPPLSWEQFRTSFLPETGATGTRVADGMLRSLPLRGEDGTDSAQQKRHIVNPKAFVVETHSVVPIMTAEWGEDRELVGWDDSAATLPSFIGALPMGDKGRSALVSSVQHIRVTRDGHPVSRAQFSITRAVEGFPAALWGGAAAHSNDPAAGLLGETHKAAVPQDAVIDATAGLSIRPAAPARAGHTREVARSVLDYDSYAVHLHGDATTASGRPHSTPWAASRAIHGTGPSPKSSWRDAVASRVAAPGSRHKRAALLRAMGFEDTRFHFDPVRLADGLVYPPRATPESTDG